MLEKIIVHQMLQLYRDEVVAHTHTHQKATIILHLCAWVNDVIIRLFGKLTMNDILEESFGIHRCLSHACFQNDT